ncbi:hypothetical protein H257_12461 [Aphanomyces astaci]|uniref:Uncharacterized protein n=1 Tax=Aphanomyces astaci TaxID=112090 RepID=W4FZ68_APHAT|nr:hypothetical protein H257_12461 [Aphanomyces astaci]ETV72291.1 hypothetical protein H257_12461 [Aphanomyces astaci]|eukprot:XP_009837973.1 hypothetical protein H257_12461 [Aphanomyces astaci]
MPFGFMVRAKHPKRLDRMIYASRAMMATVKQPPSVRGARTATCRPKIAAFIARSFLVNSTKMRCDAILSSYPDGWRSRQDNSQRTAVIDEINTVRVVNVSTPTKNPPITHAVVVEMAVAVDQPINKLMLPIAMNTEAASPNVVMTTAVILTVATPKAAISNEDMPKAANKELRLRADTINVMKVRFATTTSHSHDRPAKSFNDGYHCLAPPELYPVQNHR